MTVRPLPLDEVLARPLDFVSRPPRLRFYLTHSLVLLASLTAVAAAFYYGQAGFGLIHWVGVIFGGTVLLLSLWPASWSRRRLTNLAFDRERLYIINGVKGEAVAVPRDRVRAVDKGKLPGHDGAIIAFTLDLSLSEPELALLSQTLGSQVEDRFQLEDDRYRFGFVGNWQHRKSLLAAVSVLAPPVVETRPAPGEDDEDEDDWD
ncbi:hypothetical protein [Zobellella maritima]|uniref:hypothetical protein n=1 Tax=Zobellella maritima TaxID=2059725 RepID=UPI000E3060E5|nr:hypothetical protein [Zobellella maritima]